MNSSARAPRAALGVASIGVALALTGTFLLATPALAAEEPGIFGSTSVVLDFRNSRALGVQISTQNLSDVPAYGAASITIPDGDRYDFGPSRYAPGETRTFAAALPGHPCSDLKAMWAIAYGFADLTDDDPEWSSGSVSHPDPRVTVIGCHPTPTPTITPAPTITPTPITTPTATTTPTPPTPTATGTPVPTATIAPAGSINALPPSKTDGALLAQTRTAWGATLVIAAMVLIAVAGGLLARSRRLRASRAE